VSDHHLCPRCLREDGEPTASPGLVLIRQSRKTLYLDGGRLLVAPTDWRILCRPISSTPAVRQLSAGKSGLAQRSSPGSPKGGGRWRTSRALVARGERASCAEQRTEEATYARGRKCENALELRGRAPAEFPGQAMHGALRAAGAREVGLCPDEIEHTGQQETALWARWGAHRERVDADA
jgi:hypothetical protein